MDDDVLRPINIDEDETLDEVDELDDGLLLDGGKKKAKKDLDGDDSLDELAESEEGTLPEDAFDDVEPEDLW